MSCCHDDLERYLSVSHAPPYGYHRERYRHCNRISKTHDRDDHGRDLPRQTDRWTLMSFWPEEIEEECRAKDGCHRDPDEDIVRRDSNIIIVVHGGEVIQ